MNWVLYSLVALVVVALTILSGVGGITVLLVALVIGVGAFFVQSLINRTPNP